MDKFSFVGNGDVDSIEALYQSYRNDPATVDESWARFFEGFDFARTSYSENGTEIPENVRKEFMVINLINGYRTRGHLFTKTNPVRERRQYSPTLDLENFGLDNSDLETVFQAGSMIGIGPTSLKNIVDHLKQTYCNSIGVEFMYIRSPEIIEWLQEKMEKSRNTPNFSIEQKKTILNKLNQAVVFENFLHTKFVGQKRFSLEGAETLIPALDTVIERGAELGIDDFVIGMAHRGRLNVLANILNKTYKEIFNEFEGKRTDDSVFDGDVKYHLGYSSDQKTNKGKNIHLSLTPNPSHLEAVDPVVEGITRSKLDFKHGKNLDKAAPILIHGDAAIAGQGIVYEVVQMSQLEGYKTGGTIHLVVNNQVGFTTNYLDGRSSTYCTDVAKVVLSPVFHVNGDDVEALVYTCELAMEFRQKFHRDVFIDILCYRKYGHNEADEPRFTQPLLYKVIEKHPNPREIYAKKLADQGDIEAGIAKEMEKSFRSMLQDMLEEAKQQEKAVISSFLEGDWKGLRMATSKDFERSPETAISKKRFDELAERIVTLPENKKIYRKISKVFEDRKKMVENDTFDWAMGELLAYASLLAEGHPVRFSGQDVERGTFSHRHAVVKIEDSEEEFIPLNNLGVKDQATFEIYNSLLSEYGVLGFEFGYSMATPNALTIWEAQFGDFFNGAQIIVDQFISSAEYKWRRMNGLVMLLPHGYEGQGPEHSSARMERFLQQCADDNMQVLNCSSPANLFHAFRRQLHRDFRKPLVVFTPKSLLRHPKCFSTSKEFTTGGFREVMDDGLVAPEQARRVLLCTGKIYYDLIEYREKENMNDVAIVTLEQLYPFPMNQVKELFEKYKDAEFFWVQEEPENMGAWHFLLRYFRNAPIKGIYRKESASPATGYNKIHLEQQEEIMRQSFEKTLVKN